MTSHYTDKGTLLIRNSDIKDNCFEFSDEPIYLDEEFANKNANRKHEIGDVITVHTGDVGTSAVIDKNTDKSIGFATIITRPNLKIIDSYYLSTFLNTEKHKKWAVSISTGDGRTNYNLGDYQKLVVPLTSVDEQRKIANFILNLDNLITLHHRKFNDILVYKLSTKFLFLKFFKNVWEQRKLEDFGKATGGTSIESEFSENGIYKVISIGSYSENSKYNDQGIRAILSDKTKEKILNKSDLTMILNDKTANGRIIGRVLYIDKSGTYVYNQRTERIEIYKEYFEPIFIYQLLNAPQIRNKIIKQSQGNTQIFVNWNGIKNTDYLVPNKQEQIKISKLLTDLDNLITLHHRKYTYIFYSWEQRKAKELCSITTGKSNTQDQVQDGKYPFYIRSDVPVRSNRYLYDEEAVITIGDGNIGRVFHYVNGKFDLHQRCYKMADFKVLTAKYFYYYFSTKFYERAMSMTAKATVDSVRLEMISDMEMKFPKSTTEQTNISELLTNLDNLITLHQHKELKRRNDNNEHLRW